MFPHAPSRRTKRRVAPPLLVRKQSKRERRCLTWTHMVTGALVPLMIGIFTVVLTIQQYRISERHRQQDQQIARAYREQDQRQADDLHFQQVYRNYIKDISETVFKLKHLNQTFRDNRTKFHYIRSKTLSALRELNSKRKTQLFMFLYENNLLPTLDLSGSDLSNITLNSSTFKKYEFRNLSLPSSDLTSASFIGCQFKEGVNFKESMMYRTKFVKTNFSCIKKYTIDEPAENVYVYFDGTQLIGADFCETTLCDVSFNGADLSYANFTRATLGGRIDFEGTNLALVDFTNIWFETPIFVNILNTNMAGVRCSGESWLRTNQRGYIKMANVILPNETWLINETNLVLNGDAECKQQDLISHWSSFEHQFHSYPSLASNVTDRNCYFNFTTSIKPMFMYQEIDLSSYSFFVDTGEAEVDMSADFGCSTNRNSELKMYIWLKDSLQTRLSKIELESSPLKDGSEWQHWKEVRQILKSTRYLQIEIASLEEYQTCSIDNIRLRLGRQRGAEGMKKRLKDGKILLF
ncbi:unnamed protein product [Rotaria sp. Silwood2]|nr:unnamed protein product [Rotaria sp. Silwood2]CAF3057715.1 unnamed protein product [Rotaria sp. Silwood2]CAF3390881.1 unnamed protein product [Rotaria sp. Silwood2]CAF4248897.1 unnamed protein product [Rotaria sp. Silwood2]CAF4278381.1 unnamed protein product [Rotaria sp. Silwood2]